MLRHYTCLLLLAGLSTQAIAQLPSFGQSAAISDREILIGSPAKPDEPGEILVYQRGLTGAIWHINGTLRASDAAAGDLFGASMAVKDDRMVVTAPGATEGLGASYVFERDVSSGAWEEVAQLAVSPSLTSERLGSSVILIDDTIIVGMATQTSGAVSVYTPSAEGWQRTADLLPSVNAAGFGATLATDGANIYVGAPGHEDAGAVFVFRNVSADGEWSNEDYILTRGGLRGLGISLQVLSEGVIAAGAPGFIPGLDAGDTAPPAGSVIVFAQAESGEWIPTTTMPDDGTSLNLFGYSLAAAEDRLFVSAWGADNFSGKLYMYRAGKDGALTETGSTGGADGDQLFGIALAASGRVVVSTAPGANFGDGAASVLLTDPGTGETMAESRITPTPRVELFASSGVDCDTGMAGQFACSDVDLLAFVPLHDLGATGSVHLNDIWGWVDPETGREYGLVGRTDGTVFVDITDPLNPAYVGQLPMTEGSNPNSWRDIKVYKDHAFIVADGAGAHGMQVFDLTQLRDVEDMPADFQESAVYSDIHSAHNIVINEETGYAYAVGSQGGGTTCGGGLHMINIEEPTRPEFAGCFADAGTGRSGTGYSHDAQCVIYRGPDIAHRGKEICFGANETALSIADVTDKVAPVSLATVAYPNFAYTHQGWLTEDHSHFFMNDELDELDGLVSGTRTLIWDVTDLDDPQILKEFISENKSSDHNLYIRGNLMYQSNYLSGLRVFNISDVANPVEVGFFDSVPGGPDKAGFGGSWSNYPYFDSGKIIITSMHEGLFVLRKKTVDT